MVTVCYRTSNYGNNKVKAFILDLEDTDGSVNT